MKTAIVVSTPEAEFNALALKQRLETSFSQVAAAGFHGIELNIRNPEAEDTAGIIALSIEHALPVCALGTGRAYGEEGLSLTSPDPAVLAGAKARLRSQVDFAAELGAVVIIGLMRGVLEEGMTRARALEQLAEAVGELADYAAPAGVSLVMEPINRYETDLLNTAEEVAELARRLGRSNFGVLLDTFHMNIEEVSIFEAIRECADVLKHVHFADSNRHAPGRGHLDFLEIVATLGAVGYTGFVSCEILPLPTPEQAVALSAEYLQETLKLTR